MDNFRDSYFQINWDLGKKRLNNSVWGKQYDTGRGFAITLISNGTVVTPTTEIIRLKWEKPDGTAGYVNSTVVSGKFIIENIDQMFTLAGMVKADLELQIAGEFVASVTFFVTVDKAIAVDAIQSSSEFTALQAELLRVENAIAGVTLNTEVILARGTSPTLGDKIAELDNKVNPISTSYLINNGVTNPNMDSASGYYSSASVITAGNNKLSVTGNGTGAGVGVYKPTTIPYVSGKKVYVKAKYKVTNANCTFLNIYLCDSAYSHVTLLKSKQAPEQNVQYSNEVSGILTLPSTFVPGNIMVNVSHHYLTAAAANGMVLEIEQLQVIDLSSISGLNNLSLGFLNSLPFLNPSFKYVPKLLPVITGSPNKGIAFDGTNWFLYDNVLRFLGLKWYCIGDSISANLLYQHPVIGLTGIESFTNGGIAGMSSVAWKNGGYFDSTACTNSDLITVFLGTNDYGGNVTLGAISDAAGANTTYGALKWFVNTILTNNPDATLIFITPLQRGAFSTQPVYPAPNSIGKTLDQYVQAVKDVGALYAIPVLDLFTSSGFNSYTLPLYTKDNLHPNVLGSQLIAYKIASFLNSL